MPYRILTLDGGGCWAILQLMALADLYGADTPGREILAQFDLAAGNSGGSIVLGGLVANRTPGDLRDNFFGSLAQRHSIFVTDPGLEPIFAGWAGLGPKYSAAQKLVGLRAALNQAPENAGDVPLSRLQYDLDEHLPDVVICTFDYDRPRGILFRSNRDSLAASFTDEIDPSLAQAIHASTDAPINYFDAPAQLPKPGAAVARQFWDGGIAGYNNPVLVAVMEALANGIGAADIRVLSLGTGTTFLPYDPMSQFGDLGQPPRELPRTSPMTDFLADLGTLAGSILDDPPDIASYFAHIALGGALPPRAGGVPTPPMRSNVVRLNPMIQPVANGPGWVAPPGVADFKALKDLPIDAIQDPDIATIRAFGAAWLADTVSNQPIRVDRDTLACEIGYRTYTDGKVAWQAIQGAGRARPPVAGV